MVRRLTNVMIAQKYKSHHNGGQGQNAVSEQGRLIETYPGSIYDHIIGSNGNSHSSLAAYGLSPATISFLEGEVRGDNLRLKSDHSNSRSSSVRYGNDGRRTKGPRSS